MKYKIVGTKITIQKIEKGLLVEFFPYQYERIINGIWNGSLINACCLVICRYSWASTLENKKKLAG